MHVPDRDAIIQHIRRKANEIRRRDLIMIHEANLGHTGGDLSAADILATLYFAILDIDPSQPQDPTRDRFILSKGHSAGALYVTLALAGFFPLDELSTFAQPMSRLSGHPNRTKLPGIESNTGPLGHGLSIGVGCALGAKRKGDKWRTFVLTGDGELQEGSNWEAAMAAAHYELDNLTLIIDRNKLQLSGKTENTVGLEPLREKWEAFGWKVREVDGHNHSELWKTLYSIPFEAHKPNCVIAHTEKGHGVSFIRNRPAWHHRVPNEKELKLALAELEREGDR